jgi:DNA-binding transcriptional ArsR family regulator
MLVIDTSEKSSKALSAKNIAPEDIGAVSSPLAIKILRLLAQKPMYPIELAKALRVHEQKIYYHIHNLEKNKIISVEKAEQKQGAQAKYYVLEKPALVVAFKDFAPMQRLPERKAEFLEPFIKDGELNALIIVGSPDPHGPEKARSRDTYYGIDLALFLGSFLSSTSKFHVKLDTEVKEEDLKHNLILIGGPIVNKITTRFNEKAPIKFDQELQWDIKSTISNQVYPSGETGLIVKFKNPLTQDKSILLIAGKKHQGTRAAVLALLQHPDEIFQGNKYQKNISAKVVEGIDMDSDGIIDAVEIKE